MRTSPLSRALTTLVVIMALSLRPYTNQIRTELNRALCIQPFPCQNIERHNKPEVESRDNPELLLPPVTVNRSEREGCLIEPSINSVRVSLRVGQADLLEVRAAGNWGSKGYGQVICTRTVAQLGRAAQGHSRAAGKAPGRLHRSTGSPAPCWAGSWARAWLQPCTIPHAELPRMLACRMRLRNVPGTRTNA